MKIVAVSVTAVIAAVLTLVGWQASRTDQNANRPADAPVTGAKRLPAPEGRTILRVAGVEKGNVEAHVTELDFAALDALAREELTVYEPFVKADVTFTGIPMAELFQILGVPAGASRIGIHALDDYTVDEAVTDIASEGFLAVREGGKRMPIAKGGPIRLVFFDGEGKLGANTDSWIWSIDRMRVHR